MWTEKNLQGLAVERVDNYRKTMRRERMTCMRGNSLMQGMSGAVFLLKRTGVVYLTVTE